MTSLPPDEQKKLELSAKRRAKLGQLCANILGPGSQLPAIEEFRSIFLNQRDTVPVEIYNKVLDHAMAMVVYLIARGEVDYAEIQKNASSVDLPHFDSPLASTLRSLFQRQLDDVTKVARDVIQVIDPETLEIMRAE